MYPVLRHLVRTHNQLQIGKVNLYRESPARDADVATRVTIAWDDDTSTWPQLAPRSGAAVPTQSRWSVLWVGGTCTPQYSVLAQRRATNPTAEKRRWRWGPFAFRSVPPAAPAMAHGVYREYSTSPGRAERRVLYYNRLYSVSVSLVTSQTSSCVFEIAKFQRAIIQLWANSEGCECNLPSECQGAVGTV